jgi:hypothetical protein
MPIEPLFRCLRPLVEACFDAAKSDGGEAALPVMLQIEEEPMRPGNQRADNRRLMRVGGGATAVEPYRQGVMSVDPRQMITMRGFA